ncbi:MAG TPA: hypothetical protein VG165_05750 [Solirubrobacteraceae bacterium]|nr:hypothetical protein [Solirubrobacteraceae bacterium]
MGSLARALASAGVAMLLLPVAGAARTWGPASALTPPGEGVSSSPVSASLGAGGTVWVYQVGYASELVAQTADASGALSGEQVLSPDPGALPTLASDAAGEALAAWWDETSGAVDVSERAPQGIFAPAASFPASTTASWGADGPRLAVSPAGWAAVAYLAGDPDGQRVDVSVRPPGGVFGAPAEVAPSGGADAEIPGSVAIDDSGEVVVAYTQGGSADVAVRAAGESGAWAPAQALGAPDVDPQGPEPLVGIDAAGRAVAVWEEGGALNTVAAVEAAFLGPSGSFGPPQALGIETWNGQAPALAVSALGEVILVATPAVQEEGGFGMEPPVVVSGSTALGIFTAAEPLADEWSDSTPALAMNARGDAVVIYTPCCSGQLVARRRAPFGGFDAPEEIPTPQTDASSYDAQPGEVSLDPFGNATTTWNDVSSTAAPPYFSADGPLLDAAPAGAPPSPAAIADLLPQPVAPLDSASDLSGPPPPTWWQLDGSPATLVQDDPPSPPSRAHGVSVPAPEGRLAVAIERGPASRGPARIVVGVSCPSACRTGVTATIVTAGRRLKLPRLALATNAAGSVSGPVRLTAAATTALRVLPASAASARPRPRRRFELIVTAKAGDRDGQPQTAYAELAFVRG